MPTVAVFAHDSCRGSVSRDLAVGRTGYESCWSIVSQSRHPSTRLWATQPTETLAWFASQGKVFADWLCPGCQIFLARLQSEGKWPV